MEKTLETKTSTTHYDSTTSTPTRALSPSPDHPHSSPDPPSPALSSISSGFSHHSSLSHGSSPEQQDKTEKTKPDISSNNNLSRHNSSLSHGSSSPERAKTGKRPGSPPGNSPEYSPARSPPLEPMENRYSSWAEPPPAVVGKVDPGPADGKGGRVIGGGKGGGGRRSRAAGMSGLRRGKREETMRKVGLGFRVCGLFFCLVSFAVMATDKNKGWAVDSFFRYKEFRYCLSVNAIGFVYSFAQASYLAYHLATRESVFRHPLGYYLDFGMDQILTYLLMSASSSAATRIEDWLSNWGQDKFPQMATVSVALSYVAFLAFASNSLISGYALCAFRSA